MFENEINAFFPRYLHPTMVPIISNIFLLQPLTARCIYGAGGSGGNSHLGLIQCPGGQKTQVKIDAKKTQCNLLFIVQTSLADIEQDMAAVRN